MIITNSDDLKNICEKAKSCEYITVDTEFIRKKGVLYPYPSLIQFSLDGEIGYICDVLDKNVNLDPLRGLFINKDVIKVFHSAQQDLHVIFKLFGTMPFNVFDVQIASMFLGKYKNPSYDLLVRDFLGVQLDKELQFSNWMARPLSEKHLQYAERDVTYLFKLFPKIRDALGEKKYLWVMEEVNDIISYNKDAEVNHSLEKIALKLAHKRKKINPKYLWLLKIAINWREEYSLERNLSRNSIMDSESLYEFVYKIYNHFDELNIEKLGKSKFKKKILEEIKKESSIDRDLSEFEKLCETIIRRKNVVHFHPQLYLNLKALLSDCSVETSVQPQLIARKEDLIELAASNDLTGKFNSGWRYEVFGERAKNIL